MYVYTKSPFQVMIYNATYIKNAVTASSPALNFLNADFL
jgi:hypothetical protein